MTAKPKSGIEIDSPPAAEVEIRDNVIVSDPLEGLAVGRIVHYWPQPWEAKNAGEGPYAAIVTKVYAPLESETFIPGVVTLNVQLPQRAPIGDDPVHRYERVGHSADKAPGCWSWPER